MSAHTRCICLAHLSRAASSKTLECRYRGGARPPADAPHTGLTTPAHPADHTSIAQGLSSEEVAARCKVGVVVSRIHYLCGAKCACLSDAAL